MKLIATRSMTYATRRLQAGDEFTARSTGDARALLAIGKARRATEEDAADPAAEMAALRDQYEKVIGKRPFNGWDRETLLQKIADAGASH